MEILAKKDEELEQIKKNLAKQRAKGGRSIPSKPRQPVAQLPPMNFEQMTIQQIQQMQRRIGEMDQGLQRTMQMVGQLSRPDLALEMVVNAWKQSYYKDMLVGMYQGFKVALIGDVNWDLSNDDENWYHVTTEDQGTVTVQKKIIKLTYAKTKEMIKSDERRKFVQEREKKRREKEAEEQQKHKERQARRDNKSAEQPTDKSGNQS